MKRFFRLFSITLITLFIFPLCACEQKGSVVDYNFFNTNIHVETYGKLLENKTNKALNDLFSSLDNQFNKNKQSSLPYKLNNADKDQAITLTSDQEKVISFAKNYHAYTDKKFDPTVYPLLELWGFAPNYPSINFSVPTEDALVSAKAKVDFDYLTVDNDKIYKTKEQVKIDLGGIVKGYACDLAGKMLLDAGFTSGYVSIGGSSIYILQTDELFIHHPRANENISNALTIDKSLLNNTSVSSSGDYQRYYTVDGTRYSHLIDPVTAKPSSTGVIGATVITKNGCFADAITTALCLYEYYPDQQSSPLTNFIDKLLNDYEDLSVFVFYQKDNYNLLLTNKKQGEHFTLLDNNITIINL